MLTRAKTPDSSRETIQAIRNLLLGAPSFSVFFDGFGSEIMGSIGIDSTPSALTPHGECARIDINASDELTSFLIVMLNFLQECRIIVPCRGQQVGVFEKRDVGTIIFLPAPRNSDED